MQLHYTFIVLLCLMVELIWLHSFWYKIEVSIDSVGFVVFGRNLQTGQNFRICTSLFSNLQDILSTWQCRHWQAFSFLRCSDNWCFVIFNLSHVCLHLVLSIVVAVDAVLSALEFISERPLNLIKLKKLIHLLLTTLLQCFDTVGWVIRPVKTVGRITYIVLAQT